MEGSLHARYRFDSSSHFDTIPACDGQTDGATQTDTWRQQIPRYDTTCYFNVRSKDDMNRLNLPHGDASIASRGKISSHIAWIIVEVIASSSHIRTRNSETVVKRRKIYTSPREFSNNAEGRTDSMHDDAHMCIIGRETERDYSTCCHTDSSNDCINAFIARTLTRGRLLLTPLIDLGL